MKLRRKLEIGGIIAIVVLFIYLRTQLDWDALTDVDFITAQISSFGIWAPLIYIMAMAIAVTTPIPSFPLDFASGIMFGPYWGTAYSVIGAEIGAIIGFLLARHLGKGIVEDVFGKAVKFCESCSEKHVGWIVFFARLFPVAQFGLVSYGSGLTRISLPKFAIATFFGMIPLTFVLVNFGQHLITANLYTIAIGGVIVLLIIALPHLIHKHKPFGLRHK